MRHCHHTELFTSETRPCGHVHHQDNQLGANFPYLSSTQQLWVWGRAVFLRGLAVATEVIQKHQHQLVPLSSLICSLVSSGDTEQVIQFVCIRVCACVLACMLKRPPALRRGSLSGKATLRGAQTHTYHVWFNSKRQIDPNGRVFVSPRPSLMLMSLWIIYLCVLFAFSSCSLKE